MAQVLEHHAPAARDAPLELFAHLRWNEAISSAPENERGQLERCNAFFVLTGHHLPHAQAQGAAVALAQRQLEIAVDQCLGNARGVAVNAVQALHHDAARQRPFAQPVQHRHAGQPKAQRHGLGREARAHGIHQHQAGHALGRHRGGAPGHLTAQRVAGDDGALHLQHIEQVEHEARIGVAVVVVGLVAAGGAADERAGEAEAGQVEADDTPLALQLCDPAFPGVQAGRGAMDEHDGWRAIFPIVARANVPQMHGLALDRDEVRRRRCPACHQGLDRHIRRPRQRQRDGAGNEQQPHGTLHPHPHVGSLEVARILGRLPWQDGSLECPG